MRREHPLAPPGPPLAELERWVHELLANEGERTE